MTGAGGGYQVGFQLTPLSVDGSLDAADFKGGPHPVEKDPIYKLCLDNRDSGNKMVQEGKIEEAIARYSELIMQSRALESEPDVQWTDEGRDLVRHLRAAAYLNLSLCFLKSKQWQHAINTATRALQGDKDPPEPKENVLLPEKKAKALYRRAVALRDGFDKLDEAVKDLKKALEYVPEDKNVQLELQRTNQALAKEKKKSDKKLAGFLSSQSQGGIFSEADRQRDTKGPELPSEPVKVSDGLWVVPKEEKEAEEGVQEAKEAGIDLDELGREINELREDKPEVFSELRDKMKTLIEEEVVKQEQTSGSAEAVVTPLLLLRDDRALRWRHYTSTVQLYWTLGDGWVGEGWEGLQDADFEVRVSASELVVRCLAGPRKSEVLGPLSGRLLNEVEPGRCWFAVERDVRDPRRQRRHLVIELAKKSPGRPWTERQIFKDRSEMFNRRSFAWTPQQKEQESESSWTTLKPGRRPDVQDPFVTSRSWLCHELQQGQSAQHLYFRIILDQKKLDEALEKVPYFRLFGVDVSERFFKLFIRGDESSPIMLGELGGAVVPDETEVELTTVTREVSGHRIRGTMETLPCLDVTLRKDPESHGEWEAFIHSDEQVLNKPQGTLEEFEVRQRRRDPSPDRSDWTPDDFADEQKDKADAAFKEGIFRDAIVYYTRALRHTPRNERLLSNRSAAYCKISKYQLALDDVNLAMEIEPSWPKLHYRRGQALRGLRRWDEAVAAFEEGRDLDPQNPDWDKEVNRTRAAKELKETSSLQKAKN
ncbi:HOP2 [Symbiodinium sp. CCMP2456]|nr:HOP2 [Symbiodinium sp. CCMP2456]